MENSVTFLLNGSGLEGVELKWSFDEMFSSMIIADYDGDMNGTFEPAEVKAIKEGAFSNLSNFNYFLLIKYDKKNFPIKTVKDFKAEIVNNKLIYIFTVPFPIPATVEYKEFKIGVFDNTYYCEISFRETDAIQIKGNAAIKHEYALLDDKTNAYWGGQIIPQVIRLKIRKNNA
jgi:ABC-type uncharacterized transport system substrate-binding protein